MFQVSSDVVARRRSSRAAALEFSAKLDGVESESSVRSAASEVRFGHLVQIDERLKAMRLREFHFLTTLARGGSLHMEIFHTWSGVRALCNGERLWRCVFILVVYAGVSIGCALDSSEDSVCSSSAFEWDDYWPTILNTLATLLLAFYSNVCLGLYRGGYEACMRAKSSLLDLITLAAGQLGHHEEHRQLLLEIWRAANLAHASTYVLAGFPAATRTLISFRRLD